MSNAVFTIGHSTHSLEKFLGLLKLHNIDVVADVRSAPYSRRNPQYNRKSLQKALEDAGILYVFLGKELGARSSDPACYVNDRVQYDLLAKTELFQAGIERVVAGAGDQVIALMCAEKEPLNCHRTILVARELRRRGLNVLHILADGILESHENTVNRLQAGLGLADSDLLQSREEMAAAAYRKQAEKIAYKK